MNMSDLNKIEPWGDEERSLTSLDMPPGKPGVQTHNPPPVLSFLDQIASLQMDPETSAAHEEREAVAASYEG